MTQLAAARESNVVQIGELADEGLPLVPPGEYLATYVRHAGVTVFGCPKVRVDMRLIEHPEIVLSRWYQVSDFRGGRVKAGRHSAIVRELSAVLGRRVRCDRLPLSGLQGAIVRIVVRTVTCDYRQRRLADINKYSSIDAITERADP